jgi:hypothetical protein
MCPARSPRKFPGDEGKGVDAYILRQVRQIDPTIRIGCLVATGVGRLATPGLIRGLAGRGRKVHVWGLYDEDSIVTAILDGADNLIVDDPRLAIETRRWVRELRARPVIRRHGWVEETNAAVAPQHTIAASAAPRGPCNWLMTGKHEKPASLHLKANPSWTKGQSLKD